MRYLILTGLILFGLMGCGSSSTQEENQDQHDQTIKPLSPTPTDSSKQPPSIPDI